MRCVLIGLFLAWIVGCSGPVEAELLDVRDVSPTRLQPGHRLTIRGAGFPAGREARVTLEGFVHRPGQADRAVALELPGRTVSDERVDVVVTASAIEALGGRGTFRGVVRVGFGADALDGARVVGVRRGVVIDLLPRDAPLGEDRAFAARLGGGLAPGEDEAPGVTVERVAAGSRAAAAGIAPGDRIVGLGGLRLLSPGEFAPPSRAREVTLHLEREGAAFAVPLSLEGLEDGIDPSAVALVQLAALMWIGALLLFGPGATLLDRLAPSSERVMWPVVIAAAVLTPSLYQVLTATPLRLHALLFGVVALRGTVGILTSPSGRRRIDAALRGMAGAVAVGGALAVAMIVAGTTDLATLEAAQGPWPSDWIALRSPSGPLACAAIVLVAACGPRAVAERRGLRVLDDVLLVAIVTAALVTLAGGDSIRAALRDVRPALAWLGTVALMGLGVLGTVVLRRARDRAVRVRGSLLLMVAAALASFTALVALGWGQLEVPRAVERAIAEVLVVAAFLAAARLIVARRAAPPRPAHALL